MANLATGNSSKKEHLKVGAKTACNRKMSTASDISFFKIYAENNPESCCAACLSKLQTIKS